MEGDDVATLVADMYIFGINYHHIQRRSLAETDLTYLKAVELDLSR